MAGERNALSEAIRTVGLAAALACNFASCISSGPAGRTSTIFDYRRYRVLRMRPTVSFRRAQTAETQEHTPKRSLSRGSAYWGNAGFSISPNVLSFDRGV